VFQKQQKFCKYINVKLIVKWHVGEWWWQFECNDWSSCEVLIDSRKSHDKKMTIQRLMKFSYRC